MQALLYAAAMAAECVCVLSCPPSLAKVLSFHVCWPQKWVTHTPPQSGPLQSHTNGWQPRASYREDGLLWPVLGDEVGCAPSDREHHDEGCVQLGGGTHCCCGKRLSLQWQRQRQKGSKRQ